MKASNNLAWPLSNAFSHSTQTAPTSNDTETVAAHAQNSYRLSPCEASPVPSFQAGEQPTASLVRSEAAPREKLQAHP